MIQKYMKISGVSCLQLVSGIYEDRKATDACWCLLQLQPSHPPQTRTQTAITSCYSLPPLVYCIAPAVVSSWDKEKGEKNRASEEKSQIRK